MKFGLASVATKRVRLCCDEECRIDDVLAAYVDGILVGEKQVAHHFVSGDLVDIPVDYFPNVSLPTRMRFVLGEEEIAPPLAITSGEDVMAIVGNGELKVENLFLDNSLLRGMIVNVTNGVHATNAYIRINGQIVRSVILDPPRARDEGGSSVKFVVPIRPGDFSDSGLHVDLFVAGLEYPVANLTYTRNDSSLRANRLIKLEEKIRQLQKSTALQVEVLRDSFERRLSLQQERIDTFIEYAMALMVDNLAGQLGATDPKSFLDALRELESSAKPAQIAEDAVGRSLAVPLDSTAFVFGWYDIEARASGSFRWMGQTGLIRNPYISRPISRIDLFVSRVYGANDPALRASLDDHDLLSTAEKKGDIFVVSFAATSGGPIFGESIRIESFTSGCPATDLGTTDQRILAVGITGLTIWFSANESGQAG